MRDEHAPRDSRGAMTSEHIAEYQSTCREVEFGFVSELCQIPLETLVKHRRLRGDIAAYQCCGKSLIGSALVGFGVRQHARAESISKRAPPTPRTSPRSNETNSFPKGGDPEKTKLCRVCDVPLWGPSTTASIWVFCGSPPLPWLASGSTRP